MDATQIAEGFSQLLTRAGHVLPSTPEQRRTIAMGLAAAWNATETGYSEVARTQLVTVFKTIEEMISALAAADQLEAQRYAFPSDEDLADIPF
uniref:Uncharacterized protein n=1 Tax=viral metagenome TaxID=1070528 RepID=A0A6M3JP22_9ZZZZ